MEIIGWIITIFIYVGSFVLIVIAIYLAYKKYFEEKNNNRLEEEKLSFDKVIRQTPLKPLPVVPGYIEESIDIEPPRKARLPYEPPKIEESRSFGYALVATPISESEIEPELEVEEEILESEPDLDPDRIFLEEGLNTDTSVTIDEDSGTFFEPFEPKKILKKVPEVVEKTEPVGLAKAGDSGAYTESLSQKMARLRMLKRKRRLQDLLFNALEDSPEEINPSAYSTEPPLARASGLFPSFSSNTITARGEKNSDKK